MAEVAEAPPREQTQPVLKDVGVIQIGDNEGKGILPYLGIIAQTEPVERPKALILLGEVTGGTPASLNPAIESLVEIGVPVFVVSSAYGEDSAMRTAAYEVHRDAAKAGAIHLRDANRKTVITEVAAFAQITINQGKTGDELKQAMIDRFGSPETTTV